MLYPNQGFLSSFIVALSVRVAHNGPVFAMAGHSVFRHAGTEADFFSFAEDKIYCR